MPPGARTALGMANAGFLGITSGFIREYQSAALRFRAENAHRTPRTEKNWYYYHSAKWYYAMTEGMISSLKWGLRMSAITGGYLQLENAVDNIRGEKDCFNSAIAGGLLIGGMNALGDVTFSGSGGCGFLP